MKTLNWTIIIFDFQIVITFFYFEGFLFLNDIFDFCIFPLIYLMLYSIKRLHTFKGTLMQIWKSPYMFVFM